MGPEQESTINCLNHYPNITYWKGKKHKILAEKHRISHKQIAHVSVPYGISKHR